jgi:undecaprenyl-diphosphatase
MLNSISNFINTIDETVLFYIQEHLKNPALDRVMVFFSSLGNAGFLWIVIAFILILIKRYQKCGLSLLCAISLATFLGENLLKPLFGRVRPCNKYPEIALLIERLSSPSFPSGHTMVAFASSTLLFVYNPVFGIIAYMIATLIAFSRMYLFVHYPTDILGGIFFGVLTSLMLYHGLSHVFQTSKSNSEEKDSPQINS